MAKKILQQNGRVCHKSKKISASLNLALTSRYFLRQTLQDSHSGSLRIASQGLSRTFLKTFTAVFPVATDRLWVSK